MVTGLYFSLNKVLIFLTVLLISSFNMFQLKSFLKTTFAFGALLSVGQVSASPLTDSLILRPGFTYNTSSSYDGSGRDTVSLFKPFSDGQFYQLGTIASQSVDIRYSATLVSELSYFSGDHPDYQGVNSNKFGYKNVNGSYTSLIDSDNRNPITTSSYIQTAGQEFNFALKSPEGLFYSKDSLNPNGGSANILGLRVTTAGTVNIGESTLFGGGPLSFNLQVGDIVLFMEDMRLSGNQSVLFFGDFDYNDMAVVLRSSEVPEPATLLLLGFGALGGALRKKKACDTI